MTSVKQRDCCEGEDYVGVDAAVTPTRSTFDTYSSIGIAMENGFQKRCKNDIQPLPRQENQDVKESKSKFPMPPSFILCLPSLLSFFHGVLIPTIPHQIYELIFELIVSFDVPNLIHAVHHSSFHYFLTSRRFMRRMCRRFSTSHSVAPLHTPVDSSKKSRVRGALSSMLGGNMPTHFSISARCSRLLCWRFSEAGRGQKQQTKSVRRHDDST